jgi:hypothetical protein
MERKLYPWVGANHESRGIRGRKVLILGESSYNPKPYPDGYEISLHNRNLILDAIGYEQGTGYWNKSHFFTRVARIFGFEARNYEGRYRFWNSVAFYNFLQVVLTSPREVPQPHFWSEAVDPFLKTLEELRPDYVCSFSKRMWGHLPKASEDGIESAGNLFARKAKIFLSNGASVNLLGFTHPCGYGFCWQNVKILLDQELQ